MKAKAPYLLKKLLPQLVWEMNTDKQEIFLTFDDGPNHEITPKVLDILDDFGVKATFFCVGHNVDKYPDAYREILKRGHLTGNHTYNHLNGWKTSSQEYYDNVEKCSKVIDSIIFRPPYGKIGYTQIPYLKMKYRIIMWSVLSLDFNPKVTQEQCLRNAVEYTKKGSIVVFHDSVKASNNMFYALPRFLEYFFKKGFNFGLLSDERFN